jgi:transcriptional regulator with XRE-family HTH domain
MAKTLVQLVAENVRAAREGKGWTRAELARQATVSENTVKYVEEPDARAIGKRGSASPRLDVLDALAHAMGYPTWHLLADNFRADDKLADRPITAREQSLHDQILDSYRKLDRSAFDGNDKTATGSA